MNDKIDEKNIIIKTKILVDDVNEVKRQLNDVSTTIKNDIIGDVGIIKDKIFLTDEKIEGLEKEMEHLRTLVSQVSSSVSKMRNELVDETKRMVNLLSSIDDERMEEYNRKIINIEGGLNIISNPTSPPPFRIANKGVEETKRWKKEKEFMKLRREMEYKFEKKDKEILDINNKIISLKRDEDMWKIKLDGFYQHLQNVIKKHEEEEKEYIEEIMKRISLLKK